MGAHQPFCFFINTLTSFFLFCRELIKKVGGDMFSEHEIITICRHYGAKKVRKLRQQNHPFCACRNSPTPPFPWVFDEMSHTGGGLRVWKHGRDLTSNPIIFRADLYLFSTVRGGWLEHNCRHDTRETTKSQLRILLQHEWPLQAQRQEQVSEENALGPVPCPMPLIRRNVLQWGGVGCRLPCIFVASLY